MKRSTRPTREAAAKTEQTISRPQRLLVKLLLENEQLRQRLDL